MVQDEAKHFLPIKSDINVFDHVGDNKADDSFVFLSNINF